MDELSELEASPEDLMCEDPDDDSLWDGETASISVRSAFALAEAGTKVVTIAEELLGMLQNSLLEEE